MRHVELDATVDDWPDQDGRTRVLLLAINVNGYYSLPVRLLTLVAHGATDLARRYDTRYVEFDWTDDPDAWLERIVRWRPDILGLSVNVWNLTRMMDLTGAVKQRLPLTTVLAGGQEVTHSVIDHLETYAALDYTIDGEGEIPFRQFLAQWCSDTRQLENPAAVSGLRYRAGGRTRFTGAAEVVGALDEIPSPILAGLVPVAGKDRLGVLLESSRGCPYKCSFCFEGAKTEKVRMYSLDRLRQEALFMAERGAHYFHILDPILANSIARRLKGVAEIFAHLRETYRRMSFSVEAYADHISDKTAAHLSDCTIIDIGLQTTNPDTIQAIHRWFNEARFIEGVRLLRQLETTINIYLISGLPHETVVTFLRGIRFALDQKPTRLFLNELCLLNGTELRWRAAEYGYEFDARPPYYARANKWLTRLQLAAIQALTRDVSHRYNLSMRCFSNTVPWLTKKRREDGWNGTLRVHVGADAHTVESILAQAEEQDVELSASADSDPEAVLRLAGRFLLAGTARLKLVAPASLLRDQEYLRRLTAGAHVWQYRTFLDPPGLADRQRLLDDLGAQLERLGRLHPRDSEQIKPHVEVCLLPAPVDHVAEAVRWAATQSAVSVVTALPPSVDTDATWSAAVAELFPVVIMAGRWLRLPERTMRRVLAAAGVEEMDEVLLHLEALDLLVPDDVRLLLPTSPDEPGGTLRSRPSRLSASQAERDPVVMRNR